MTSAINPNNIDGTYPVAGQDNNSQGFRDNFTNTKTNFEYAAAEITNLQNSVLLKAPLTGTTLDNDMNDQLIYAGVIRDFGATRIALGSVSGVKNIDYSLGHFQTMSTTGPVSLNFSNFPALGTAGVVTVSVTVNNVAHTLTLPSSVSINNTGIQGLEPSSNTITFASTGTYTFQFISSDNGSTITVNEVNKKLQPFNNTNEDLADATAASLAVTTSYFSTTSAETATLAAGVSGQIKVFTAVDVTSGNMVITVTNAGWKASGTGTITFSGRGQGCTLQYVNAKWFCIGNNGCTFA